MSDKEGGFVISSEVAFRRRSGEVLQTHFTMTDLDPKDVGRNAMEMCEAQSLHRMAKDFKGGKFFSLQVFVSVKTHKEQCSFRATVS